MRRATLVLALSMGAAIVGGEAQARQDPGGSDPGLTTVRSEALGGDVAVRLSREGEIASEAERPVVVTFMPPEEAAALTEGLAQCGRERSFCSFSLPAYQVTILEVDPTQVARLAAGRPDPSAATAEFLGVELPEWTFERVEPDDVLVIAGAAEGSLVLRAVLRAPGAYDEALLLEPEIDPEGARALMGAVPPAGGETTAVTIYAHGWTPGDDLGLETLVNGMLDGPYYVAWTEPDDQAWDPDGERRAFALGAVWRFAAVPPW
jgi:hypothetical protein